LHKTCPGYYTNTKQFFCLSAACWLSLFPINRARIRNTQLPSPAILHRMFPFSHTKQKRYILSKLQTWAFTDSEQLNYNIKF
jgi:hypothetical protein